METEVRLNSTGDNGGPETGAGSLNVLVVENHSDTREGVRSFLQMLGHRPSCAESMAAAVAMAEQERFDVLLSDISLPDGDGWKLLEQLEDRDVRPTHAIAMSGLGSAADHLRSRVAGFEIHLVKPFAPETLAEALERVVVLHLTGEAGAGEAAGQTPPGGQSVAPWQQKMHDGLCQQLVAASLLQEALIRRLEKIVLAKTDGGPLEEVVMEARNISRLLDDALTESRLLMREG